LTWDKVSTITAWLSRLAPEIKKPERTPTVIVIGQSKAAGATALNRLSQNRWMTGSRARAWTFSIFPRKRVAEAGAVFLKNSAVS